MFRSAIFLLILTITAISCTWLLDNDGSVVVEWLGYRIQTSTSFTLLAGSILIMFLLTLMQFFFWLINGPKRYKQHQKEKKRKAGILAITESLVAIATGDSKQAKLFSKKASSCLGKIPITHILAAQTAQLNGDTESAKSHYTALLDNKETEIIAIKGLLIEAQKENDLNKAIFLAQKALSLRPDAAWGITVLIELYTKLEKWSDAIEMINNATKRKILNNKQTERMLGIIYLSQAQANLNTNNIKEAEENIKLALKFLPNFVPAITNQARILLKNDEKNKALKILFNTWKETSHPDIINCYILALYNEPNSTKIGKINKLISIHKHDQVGHLYLARLYIDFGDYVNAKNHLDIALSIKETKLLCSLMIDLQKRLDSGDAIIDHWQEREKQAQKDSSWYCNHCKYTTVDWHSNCSNCNSFDSLVFGIVENFALNSLNVKSYTYI